MHTLSLCEQWKSVISRLSSRVDLISSSHRSSFTISYIHTVSLYISTISLSNWVNFSFNCDSNRVVRGVWRNKKNHCERNFEISKTNRLIKKINKLRTLFHHLDEDQVQSIKIWGTFAYNERFNGTQTFISSSATRNYCRRRIL